MTVLSDYLTGEKFSSNLRIDFSSLSHKHPNELLGRNTFISEYCRGKITAHIGCADHVELIAGKVAARKYLHADLIESSSLVVGIDTNLDGIDEMIRLGFDKGSLYTSVKTVSNLYSFDCVVVPDVIEHIDNISNFLHELHSLDSEFFLFSTPNVFALNYRRSFSSESVNSDHRVWFSPYTLVKTLHEAGYSVTEVYLIDLFRKRFPLRSLLMKYYPGLREHLVVVAKKPAKDFSGA